MNPSPKYRRDQLNGQEFVLPTKEQWKSICAEGVFEGQTLSVEGHLPGWPLSFITHWLAEYSMFSEAQLGATRLRDRWLFVPLLCLNGKHLRVHFENVMCDKCNKRCGPSATPDTVAYAGSELSYKEDWGEFQNLPIQDCPHCGNVLRLRQTIWLAADNI